LIFAIAAVLLVVLVPLNKIIDKTCPVYLYEGREIDIINEAVEPPTSNKCY
jgi:hypothetical protein